MKKSWWAFLIIFILIVIAYVLMGKANLEKPVDKNELQGSKEVSINNDEFVKKSINNSLVDKGCESIFSLCPECIQKWDALLDEIIQVGEDAAGQGVYSLMPEESLIALAEQSEPNSMLYHGVNLVWQGTVGIKAFRHSSNYKELSNEEIKNYKIDIDLIRRGEDYLFQAAVKGKHMAWSELRNSKAMTFRKHLKDGVKDEVVLKELIAHQIAIANTVKHIYQNDPFILEYYFLGMDSDIKSALWGLIFNGQAELIKEEKEDIEKLARKFEQDYFNKWQEARIYLGESIYPKEFPDNFSDFYKVAMPLCLPDY